MNIEPKEQIGVIVYPSDEGSKSQFVKHHVSKERSKGNVIVFCAGYARIHKG